jgi:hypothetical protein
MSNPGFKDVDFGKPKPQGHINTPPDSPEKKHRPMELPLHKTREKGSGGGTSHARPSSRGNVSIGHRRRTSWGELEGNLTIPLSPGSHNTIEVPALRSPDADSSQYMHNLSAAPSMKERRVSRNSFGASLPIPKSKRQSRLSAVAYPDAQAALKAGMAGVLPIQATREILASQVQDVHSEKVKAAKNMAFVFDIDGVLVHGDRLIPQGKQTLDMLNGNNQLGIKIPHIFLTNGSGKPELARTEQLSKILQNPINTDQFIQSHTPMRALAEYYSTVPATTCSNGSSRMVRRSTTAPAPARCRSSATRCASICRLVFRC